MFAFIFILSIFGCAFGGVPRKFDGRIVGGSDTNITDVPFQISLRYFGGHTCGGSILNEDTILTAAHCLWQDADPSDYSIRAGSSLKSSGGQLIEVSKLIFHPKYDEKEELDWDACILKLKEKLVFGPGVVPAKLPALGLEIEAGTTTHVSGWGALIFQQPERPEILQRVSVPIVSEEDCSKKYLFVGERQICAGAEGRDACQGDSGGPLVYNDMVVGLVSWGYACAYEGYPTVYTRVSQFVPWIKENM